MSGVWCDRCGCNHPLAPEGARGYSAEKLLERMTCRELEAAANKRRVSRKHLRLVDGARRD